MKKALVMLASALAIGSAFAQTPASAPAASAPAAQTKHERNVEDRITYLHQQLKITSAQDAQWNTFADAMRSNGETMAQLFQQRRAEANPSAIDNMKQYATIAQAHADGMKRLVDAFQPLYDSMSPEQKKLADTTFNKQGPGGPARRAPHRKAPAPGAAASAPDVKP